MQAQERRKEEEAMTDPKKRLLRLMLKAKAKMKEEKARAEAVSSTEQVTNTTSTV
jgi:hypothetical protein